MHFMHKVLSKAVEMNPFYQYFLFKHHAATRGTLKHVGHVNYSLFVFISFDSWLRVCLWLAFSTSGRSKSGHSNLLDWKACCMTSFIWAYTLPWKKYDHDLYTILDSVFPFGTLTKSSISLALPYFVRNFVSWDGQCYFYIKIMWLTVKHTQEVLEAVVVVAEVVDLEEEDFEVVDVEEEEEAEVRYHCYYIIYYILKTLKVSI